MVSPQNPTNPEAATIAGRSDRGFVPEYAATAGQPAVGYTSVAPGTRDYFWGSVVAGTVSAISIGYLSLALMIGCHVGTTHTGEIAFGWGSAIWMIITSAIAYYVGGMIASSFANNAQSGWLRGMTVWGLSVPLLFLLMAVISGGFGLAYGSATSHVADTVAAGSQSPTVGRGDMFANFGGAWTVFISLAVGLFCALAGGSTGSRNMDRMMTNLPGSGVGDTTTAR
ncbi:MAG TPA: hypothetical protein VG269_04950 [Tepidisphaeraceae bacterium]|jgi:hypothetical protein|nr:hypothetical protein [Tepidisphaeraceae bacterium]